jgi:cytochrome bd-type quinol oxidase subunit 2
MPNRADHFRAAAWLFALTAVGYALVAGHSVFVTNPAHIGWLTYWHISSDLVLAVCAPLVVSLCCSAFLFTRGAARVVLTISSAMCAALVISGWGLMALPMIAPAMILARRLQQMSLAKEPVA